MTNKTHLRNELVIKGTRIGVWDWNIQTGETYFNERWAEIIGYTLEELYPISIDTWIQHAHPEDLVESNKCLNHHFCGITEYYDFKSRMKHKDGHWIWVHDRGKVFEWDSDGNPLRMCGSHIEITDEKKIELDLKRAIEERDILLREIHHRVKNNLQLLLSLGRLKDKNGFIATHEIEDSINSIVQAYEAIYKSDRIDKISIKAYLEEIVIPLVSSRSISFKFDVPELNWNIDFLIPLGLIVTELVNNSLKHAFSNYKNGQINLTIDRNEDNLLISYSDNGKGYGNVLLNDINQLETFGLTIIHGLVGQINGTIHFYDRHGGCCEINIKLNS
jgi:PAS domain S-box-containing protein